MVKAFYTLMAISLLSVALFFLFHHVLCLIPLAIAEALFPLCATYYLRHQLMALDRAEETSEENASKKRGEFSEFDMTKVKLALFSCLGLAFSFVSLRLFFKVLTWPIPAWSYFGYFLYVLYWVAYFFYFRPMLETERKEHWILTIASAVYMAVMIGALSLI